MKTLKFFFLLLTATLAGLAATQHVSAELQAALDQAQNGDTLIVAAGRYEAQSQ